MPLTPEDVSNKRFTPVRLREGYDMGEVDAFLDEIEAELARLTRENQDLRGKGPAPRSGASAPPVQDKAAEPAKAGPTETIKVTTVSDASSAAARLLEIATRNADELVGEAREEANKILAEAKDRTDRLEEDARNRSQALEAETEERRSQLFGDLEEEKSRLNGEIETLRAFEREYRARLKTYFEEQLGALDGSGESGLVHDGDARDTGGLNRS